VQIVFLSYIRNFPRINRIFLFQNMNIFRAGCGTFWKADPDPEHWFIYGTCHSSTYSRKVPVPYFYISLLTSSRITTRNRTSVTDSPLPIISKPRECVPHRSKIWRPRSTQRWLWGSTVRMLVFKLPFLKMIRIPIRWKMEDTVKYRTRTEVLSFKLPLSEQCVHSTLKKNFFIMHTLDKKSCTCNFFFILTGII
jgi:hypothetical protein